MTTTVQLNRGDFYVNNPTITFSTITTKLWLRSEYSQEYEGPFDVTLITQTDRYAKLIVEFPNDWDENHKNGFYTYYIGQGANTQPDIIYTQDIVKIITEPGGGAGEDEYISTNERREADVYYRPNY